jgi:class 3 adenylate cyclase
MAQLRRPGAIDESPTQVTRINCRHPHDPDGDGHEHLLVRRFGIAGALLISVAVHVPLSSQWAARNPAGRSSFENQTAKAVGRHISSHPARSSERYELAVANAISLNYQACLKAVPAAVGVQAVVIGNSGWTGRSVSSGFSSFPDIPRDHQPDCRSMVQIPETKYVPVGDSDVAYQIVGSGPFDLLYVNPLGVHVDSGWDFSPVAKAWSMLATGCRLILLDRRGTGASGGLPVSAIPTWEELAEDIIAVLDAAGSTRCAVMSQLETGPIAILLAATHPERMSSLILLTTTARYSEADDYPIGVPNEVAEGVLDLVAEKWGSEELGRFVWLDEGDPELHRSQGRMQRAGATPREAHAQYRYFAWNVDVREVLPLVQVPTLVIHTRDNAFYPVSHGRYLAEHIADATFVEVPAGNLVPLDEETMGRVVEFVTGARPVVEVDRVLTTILFTDIVGSTEQATSLGDQRWRNLLDAHDRVVREQLRLFRGNEINTTGDGFLATFDGPARALRCGQAIVEALSALGIDVRVGVHSGECEVRGGDLGGLAVHIGARTAALAAPGEVLVSQMVKELVMGSGIEFEDRGEHELKGIPGSWQLFAVSDAWRTDL